jgi:hypothetical protein
LFSFALSDCQSEKWFPNYFAMLLARIVSFQVAFPQPSQNGLSSTEITFVLQFVNEVTRMQILEAFSTMRALKALQMIHVFLEPNSGT